MSTEAVPDPADTVAFEQYALSRAINGLRDDDPMRSASVPVLGWQRWALWATLFALVIFAAWKPMATSVVLVGLCTATYVFTMVDRVLLFRDGLASRPIIVSDEEARAVPDDQLPMYTVLVPAYDEPEVVANLIAAMKNLEYPADKLQVLLLLEADDAATIAAARATAESEAITILLVPPAEPRTKPKACNFGLFYATGDIVTIYDAEDLPESLQLRRVAVAFDRLSDDVACVQAELAYHNGRQNVLTGWFTAEYALWFGFLLPGFMRRNSPIPLGGTSNHLRRSILDEIGSWDPFNVTEDADLGVRIAASGYRTAIIDSRTMEEANSDPVNWVRQRSRWYKGYLQTWLVHMRQPLALYRTIGLRSLIRFNLVMAGTPIVTVLNLIFWLITVLWFLGQPTLIGAVFPWFIYFPALCALVLGNFATLYMNLITLCEDDRPDLLGPALTVPLFWLMMSIAATKGVYQLIRRPSYWEKTFHGLDTK
ncbi:glycosyltransferase [Mycolicibacterium parafortuitum]|uniref:Glycosyl transferase family 2 [Nocardia brasiliensis ATCC] n=1 Tax=Mycolicibacterium parafortuitum TaxID=39692 RepID=A0A375YK46_MYCPF|nr:glycosyltransferase [Mycolicibacterium parafortuitum]ORB25266.1 N-acetylglucosaminyltransferase [Mycolicibacterium parafortuitum]SRX81527.1 glycosyl transferase family 2 [Nocardia brasiliensis ATCC] [Mycolicibacterium parafortuitum]